MRSLSSIVMLLGLTSALFAQSPHGPELKAGCSDCHSAFSWEVDADTLSFNHDATVRT